MWYLWEVVSLQLLIIFSWLLIPKYFNAHFVFWGKKPPHDDTNISWVYGLSYLNVQLCWNFSYCCLVWRKYQMHNLLFFSYISSLTLAAWIQVVFLPSVKDLSVKALYSPALRIFWLPSFSFTLREKWKCDRLTCAALSIIHIQLWQSPLRQLS